MDFNMGIITQSAIVPPRLAKRTAGPAHGMQTTAADISMTDLTCPNQPTVAAERDEYESTTRFNNVVEHRQVPSDTDNAPQPGLIRLVCKTPIMGIAHERQKQGNNSTQRREPANKGFCRTDERKGPQHMGELPPEQTNGGNEMGLGSATNFVKETPPIKKEWEFLVCHECINAKHLVKHRELYGVDYKGRAGGLVCSQNNCRRWISSLWKAYFVRSEDCSHSHNATPPPEASASRSTRDLRSRKSPRRKPKADSKHSKNKVSKNVTYQLAPARNKKGKFTKRSRQQSNIVVAKEIADLTDGTATLNGQDGVLEQRQARVPSPVLVTNGNVKQRLESFDLDILDTYQGKHLEEKLVEKSWVYFAKKISEFDLDVRGIASNKDVRDKLSFLDDITPFSVLQEIGEESESPEEYDDPSRLLWLLKNMFKVPMYTSLDSAISDQIRQLKFPHVLRATLAYLIHLKIFSARGRRSEWRELEKRSIDVCGEQQGAALLQYLRLGAQQSDHFKRSLRHRAGKLASSIYTTLLPLFHRVEDRPKNDREKHIELLTRLTHDCLSLATDLHAREGTFNFIWPEYGSHFDPDLHSVDALQSDAVSRMADEVVKKQEIAFALMPVVQRVLPYEEEALPYARGVVLLKEPYAE